MRRRRFAVACVFVVLGSLAAVPHALASATCESVLPANINAGQLRQHMIVLLQRSETFRQQCRRIAAVPFVRVKFEIGVNVDSGGRAESLIYRYQEGAVLVWVTVRFAEDYLELIPHELEHVIEQVDGVRLREEVAAHRAWLTESGAFETARARDAGYRVRRELDALTVESLQGNASKPPTRRHPFD